MPVLGIIPARYASSRFPGKPLVDILGKTMIQRVYEQAQLSQKLDKVLVATDDERIFKHVSSFGGTAFYTSAAHQSGTDRCAEVALELPEFDIIVNIQGDEPFIDPRQIDLLCECFGESDTQLATLVKKIENQQEIQNPNSPKVILNSKSEAVYFSRTPIPYLRGVDQNDWLVKHTFYKHIGIYGYRRDALLSITKLSISSLEKAEALEQLRWIENGYRIKTATTTLETQAIDTPEDLEAVLNQVR